MEGRRPDAQLFPISPRTSSLFASSARSGLAPGKGNNGDWSDVDGQ